MAPSCTKNIAIRTNIDQSLIGKWITINDQTISKIILTAVGKTK